jgi:hypothetical protein
MWNCYLTIFRAESPVHIGYRQIGVLKTTRYYITSRAMWGSITANLTRALFENPTSDNYRKVGEFVKKYGSNRWFSAGQSAPKGYQAKILWDNLAGSGRGVNAKFFS